MDLPGVIALRLLIGLCFLLGAQHSYGQRQLIITTRDDVISRFSEGERIRYKLKNSREEHRAFIVEIHEFHIITNYDTVKLRDIGRVAPEKRNVSLLNKIGKCLVIAGVGYLVIDQFNSIVVRGEDPHVSEEVLKPAIVMTSIGLPLVLIRKDFIKLWGVSKLITITHDSPLFKYDQ